MGNSEGGDKNTNNDENKGEGFFGDPKIRHATIGGILLAMCVLQLPLVSESLDGAKDAKDLCESLGGYLGTYGAYGGAYGGVESYCDGYDQLISGLSLHLTGLVFILVFSLCAILVHFIDTASCGKSETIGLVFMIFLILGGFFVILGHFLWKIEPSSGSNDTVNWMLTCSFCENFLGGVTAIIFGYDVWKQVLNDSTKRMYMQSLALLTFVSLLCFLGYAVVGSEIEHEETQLIAAGYFFILLGCVLYLVFNFKIDNKIHQMMGSIGIGIILIFGSFLCAIGYWGGYTCDYGSACSDNNAYVTGYIFVLIGICVVNALDRGLYDNAKLYKDTPKPTS